MALVLLGVYLRDAYLNSGADWVPVLGIVVGAVGGAAIGAIAAWWVARENRAEASRTRFHNDLRQVSSELLRAAELHQKQRRQQFESWRQRASEETGVTTIPDVDDTEPVYYAAVVLSLTASTETVGTGWALYKATIRLDNDGDTGHMTYDLSHYARPDGMVEAPSAATVAAYGHAVATYKVAVLAFVNAVRTELDEEVLLGLPEY